MDTNHPDDCEVVDFRNAPGLTVQQITRRSLEQEVANWQRHAVRLAFMLLLALPKDAKEFFQLDRRVRDGLSGEWLRSLSDPSVMHRSLFDHDVLNEPRLQHIVGADLIEQIRNLPDDVVLSA